MIPSYDKIHLRFKLNGSSYDKESLKEVSYSLIKEGEAYEKIIGDFLLDWLDDKESVEVKTSGSTGTPKVISVSKQAMVHSALATGNYFKLSPGDRALHCLPTNFIAGKMMLVRAMILGLELDMVAPSRLPAYDDQVVYDFCAMIPMQVKDNLERLKNIKTLIVGGAAFPATLMPFIQDLPGNVYATYGMTETLSHIAVKPLNHLKKAAHFQVLEGIDISQDERGCLVIDAPDLMVEKLVTNDIVELYSDKEFDVLGRIDNVINSGGVKLFPEQIEAKLDSNIGQRFFISSEEDEVLGEKVILVVEKDDSSITPSTFKVLDKFEKPKAVYVLEQFEETISGKIRRKNTLELLKKHSKQKPLI
ncbi:AMP-binding protein [Mangrovimonas sp. DI 80]|uniref:AMP-binding protein n=1 Tax=Mangrovimonas sp. DI 80 TaxID=1779330 RepID=UPI000977E22E|nr:AMP-binding protein [Mangrovimonas sp. DI 80]OMP30907.1 O-succinylbenzoic acid--CoA ligase [Mangrovimonas sp. DI 80]